MAKNEHVVTTRIESFYYGFLKTQAKKNETSVSDMVRKIIEYQVDKFGGATSVSLEDKQLVRLNEIAKEKGLSANDLMTRIISNYIETYF